MKFDIVKKVNLEYEGWEDCYLEFSLPSYGDLKELSIDEKKPDNEKIEQALEMISGLFKSGFAMSEGKRVAVKKEDLKDLPIEILTKCFKEISGEVPPK